MSSARQLSLVECGKVVSSRTISAFLLCLAAWTCAAADSRGVDYGKGIQPLLAERCYSCHGPEKQNSGLRLDRKLRALRGGDSGKAIIPAKRSASLLIKDVERTRADT